MAHNQLAIGSQEHAALMTYKNGCAKFIFYLANNFTELLLTDIEQSAGFVDGAAMNDELQIGQMFGAHSLSSLVMTTTNKRNK